jgi:DNA-binding PadR family transcriptional regulator
MGDELCVGSLSRGDLGTRNWSKELELEKGNDGIWVQKRDLEILKMCLEMKFADVESLNQKYFDANSREMFAARKRIQKLETSGLLRSVSLLSGTAKKFYVTTPKGHRELTRQAFLIGGPKPISKLSVVTFEHDLGVLKTRMLLEKQGRVTNWRSERLLKSQAEAATGRLQRDFMPDAIFTSKQGKVCAFEFENKPKTEAQLREKIFRLKALMDQADPVFEACLFIASTENLKTKIQHITQVFPNKFVVQSVMELETFKEGKAVLK